MDISNGGDGNTVQGNDIGTQAGGTGALGNHDAGVVVATDGNTVGGTTTAARNIIADNASNGVALDGSGNLVEGNYIGVDASGNTALGNQGDGVFVGGSNNTVGGSATGAGNVISGNTQNGVEIAGDAATNLVAGNMIGTDSSGTIALGNSLAGVAISSVGTPGNTVGGTTTAARNLISANKGAGVAISGGASADVVAGNYIGTDVTGSLALGNLGGGVAIAGASDNTIGGTTTTARNVISGNTGVGILVMSAVSFPASGNLIAGNYIGTDATGKLALGNTGDGVQLNGAASNTVGGTTPGALNVIAANGGNGVLVQNAAGNVISGNYIGTDFTGKIGVDAHGKTLGNTDDGIDLNGATSTTVGGLAAGSGNVLSNNGQSGIRARRGLGAALATTSSSAT